MTWELFSTISEINTFYLLSDWPQTKSRVINIWQYMYALLSCLRQNSLYTCTSVKQEKEILYFSQSQAKSFYTLANQEKEFLYFSQSAKSFCTSVNQQKEFLYFSQSKNNVFNSVNQDKGVLYFSQSGNRISILQPIRKSKLKGKRYWSLYMLHPAYSQTHDGSKHKPKPFH